MKVKKIEKGHVGHNSGGAGREQQHLWMMNIARAIIPIAKSLVVEKNPFNFYDGYQNLEHSTI